MVTNNLTSFSRMMRGLDAEGMSPALLGVVLIAGLAGVWTSWLIAARVPVYHISEAARLEVERIHPVSSPVVGRVVVSSLVLGREVKQGDVLLEVEAERERLETAEERMRLSSVSSELTELQREIARGTGGDRRHPPCLECGAGGGAAAPCRRGRGRRSGLDKHTRAAQLEKLGSISAADVANARADEQARRAEVSAARAGIDRLRAEQAAAERERRGRVAALVRERVSLEGLRDTSLSTVARRETEAERRRIRAPSRVGLVKSTPSK